MTNNQLTYWANIERERANRASELLQKQAIAAQRYSARLNYAASIYGAKMNYAARMNELSWSKQSFYEGNEFALKKQEQEYTYREYLEYIKKYGVFAGAAESGSRKVTNAYDYMVSRTREAANYLSRGLNSLFGRTYTRKGSAETGGSSW